SLRRDADRCRRGWPGADHDPARQRRGRGRALRPHAARPRVAAQRPRPRLPRCERRARADGSRAERAHPRRGPRLARGHAPPPAHPRAHRGAVMPEIRREVDGRVLVLTVDNVAKKNAFVPEMMRDLTLALTDFDRDDALWVAVLTFAGEHTTA